MKGEKKRTASKSRKRQNEIKWEKKIDDTS